MSASNSTLNAKIEALKVTMDGKKFIPFEPGCAYIMENGLFPLFKYLETGDEGYASHLNRQTFGVVYAIVYTMCTQPAPNNYMKNVYDQQIKWNETFLQNIRDDIRAQPLVELRVQRYFHHWKNYQEILMKWYLNFFVFIQYSYIPFNNLPHLDTQLIKQWHTMIYEEFKMEIMNYFMTEMNKDRTNEIIHNKDLTYYITIFTKLTDENSNTMYHTEFERFFLDKSAEFFDGIKGHWRESKTNMNYCSYIYTFMTAEKNRVSQYLLKSTEKPLMDLIIDRFITTIHHEILTHTEDGFIYYLHRLTKENTEVFTQIYGVMSIVPNNQGIETMASLMRDFITHQMRTSIHDMISREMKINELNTTLCKYVIDTHDLYTHLIHSSFSDNTIIQTMFVNTMKTILNDTYPKNIKFNKHLPMFIHGTIRNKDLNDEMKYDIIQQIIIISRYITDKDIYMEYTRNYLKDRLLSTSSVNVEMEQEILTRYSNMYGVSFCEKVVGMLNDYIRCSSTAGSNSHIYTHSHWPNLVNTPNVRLPDELREVYNAAEAMYLDPFTVGGNPPSRKVQWYYTFGHLNMEVFYPKGKKHIFELNILQYVVFNMFMGHLNPIHYDTLLRESGIGVSDYLDRVLDSLMRPKLILKNESDNTYRFNPGFSSKFMKVVIQCLPFVEVAVARETIEIDRTHTVQSVIVRVMKIRKTMSHVDLVNTVLSECVKFTPETKFIKANIETLIEKEYLERDSTNSSLYKYLA